MSSADRKWIHGNDYGSGLGALDLDPVGTVGVGAIGDAESYLVHDPALVVDRKRAPDRAQQRDVGGRLGAQHEHESAEKAGQRDGIEDSARSEEVTDAAGEHFLRGIADESLRRP